MQRCRRAGFYPPDTYSTSFSLVQLCSTPFYFLLPFGQDGACLLSWVSAPGVQNLPTFDPIDSQEWGISNTCVAVSIRNFKEFLFPKKPSEVAKAGVILCSVLLPGIYLGHCLSAGATARGTLSSEFLAVVVLILIIPITQMGKQAR